jgi:CubicO group peptidase (beta-lactamase class C family)
MKILILTLIQLTFSTCAFCQDGEKKIREVENGLNGWVKIEGRAGWNITERMKYYNVKGLSIAVIDNYRIVWAKGYGYADTTARIPVTTNTLFQPASIGKSTHAFATMTLIEKHMLDPGADINFYLKRWKFPYDSISKGKKINTYQLLSHTAGLSVHGFDGYKIGQPLPTIFQILEGKQPSNSPAVRSLYEPGRQWEYSGGGYTISGMILEDITGKKYADYLSEKVFRPLAMDHTFFNEPVPEIEKRNLATAYRADNKAIGCKFHVYPEDACGASMWSTPTDFARFIIEIQNSLAGKSNTILTRESAEKLLTPVMNNYGLGFFIEQRGDQKYFHHTGLNEGFVSDYYGSFEGGKGVVIMANSDVAYHADITEEIVNSVSTAYGWKDFYQPVEKKEVLVAPDLRKQYVGVYKFDGVDQTVTIYEKGGRMWFHDSSSPVPWLMHFCTTGDFCLIRSTLITINFPGMIREKLMVSSFKQRRGVSRLKKTDRNTPATPLPN